MSDTAAGATLRWEVSMRYSLALLVLAGGCGVRDDLTDVERRVDALEQMAVRYEALEAQVSSQADGLDEVSGRVDELQTELTGLAGDVDVLGANLDSLDADLDLLDAALTEVAAELGEPRPSWKKVGNCGCDPNTASTWATTGVNLDVDVSSGGPVLFVSAIDTDATRSDGLYIDLRLKVVDAASGSVIYTGPEFSLATYWLPSDSFTLVDQVDLPAAGDYEFQIEARNAVNAYIENYVLLTWGL